MNPILKHLLLSGKTPPFNLVKFINESATSLSVNPKISIIVPAFNEERSLEYVLNQLERYASSRDDVRVVPVDDGSKDATWEIMQQNKNRYIAPLQLPQNSGKGAAMLFGLQNSEGPLVGFLDADLIGRIEENLPQMVDPVEQCHVIDMDLW